MGDHADASRRGHEAQYWKKTLVGRSGKPFWIGLYRYRNLAERFFNKLEHFRAIATRFEMHDANYLARVKNLSRTGLIRRTHPFRSARGRRSAC